MPVDPVSKMPKTAYERNKKLRHERKCSIDSESTICSVTIDVDAEKLKKFYRSIPDYKDINHLPTEEFYSTLKLLRDQKRSMIGYARDKVNDDRNFYTKSGENYALQASQLKSSCETYKSNKSMLHRNIKRKFSRDIKKTNGNENKSKANVAKQVNTNISESRIKEPGNINISHVEDNNENNSKGVPAKNTENFDKSIMSKTELRPKRYHSACSISWNDRKIENRSEMDQKFDKFFEGRNFNKKSFDDDFRTRSMPSSPLRNRRGGSPMSRRKSVTIPKPFKMTERDEDERAVNELRSIQKSLSDDMLLRKKDRKIFRARPVPIESRIPLYDKILEDQAMRRAITKINSEAELRAQMKPFNFTKREEKGISSSLCERAVQVVPKPKKKKRFRARPVPRNLFSNYFYDKQREDQFFRSFNRRIRAEEMLRNASLPGSMATRDRSRLSTPAAHSDLPIDPSPQVPSVVSTDRQISRSPSKLQKKREKKSRNDFITTSPQPFHLNTAERAAKKMEEITKKFYTESKSTPSVGGSGNCGGNRVYSALELRAHAAGRSNLAALLRAEAVRRRFEMETTRRLEEQRRRADHRARDRQLRSNPAWHLVKNNHEEDIAMRLQTRRDEERMRREEFLHEMELMYGRVQQQPLLFERYYAPRCDMPIFNSIPLSPRKHSGKRRSSSRKSKTYHYNSPERSRKVSINDTGNHKEDIMEYLNRIDNEKDYSDSDAALESFDGGK